MTRAGLDIGLVDLLIDLPESIELIRILPKNIGNAFDLL